MVLVSLLRWLYFYFFTCSCIILISAAGGYICLSKTCEILQVVDKGLVPDNLVYYLVHQMSKAQSNFVC